VLSEELGTFLESGCGLLVGSVSPDGAPHAARGWAARVVDAGVLRVVVSAADDVLLDNLAATGAVAITGADVQTLRSSQVKGRVRSVVTATETDVALVEAYCDGFFRRIHELDGNPIEQLRRLVPTAFSAVELDVLEGFDQTPGPGAGVALGRPQ
jgi:hypothetical protein